MKDKQKKLEDLDFVTEMTMSELEEINGGNSALIYSNDLTAEKKPPEHFPGRGPTPIPTDWSEDPTSTPYKW